MDKFDSYRILLKNREIVKSKKMNEIIPDLFDKQIPATYGYFFLQEIYIDCDKSLKYLDDFEKALGVAKCEKLKQICEDETSRIISLGEIEEKVKLKAKYLATILTKLPSDCIYCFAHLFLFTKNLLNIKGGKMFDPTGRDGLYSDLKNAKKFYESVLELRKWESDKLWEAVWEPLGGEPSDEELEKIPEDKIPFEIECIDWTWNWSVFGETVYGYLIDVQDLRVHPSETLEDLERRIDRAITPIKKYLTKKRPNLSEWWG
ncbi:MAG: hypothetical protein NZ903_02015 [Candidatus Micrarchaeota archaeon]|nr:hypothetical protein [Candidatus Micrarchaeota archaeon]